MTALATINKSKFDFESGYITQSPCRGCERARHLPYCSNDCPVISRLQTRLAGTISSSNPFSELDDYSLSPSICANF